MGKRMQIVLAGAGMTLIWPYLQHFFFRVTFFDNIAMFDSLIGFGLFLFIVATAAASAALWPARVGKLLSSRVGMAAVLALSLAGSSIVTFFGGHAADPVFAVVVFLGVALYSIGFAAVFFAWMLELKQLVFRTSLGTVFAVSVVSALLGYLITPTFISDTWFYRLFPVFGIPLSGMCLVVLTRSYPLEATECNPVLKSQSVKRWGLLFAAYFVISMMHAIFFYIDRESDFSADSVLSFAVLFLFMGLLLFMALHKRGKAFHLGQKTLWYVAVGLVVVLYAGLLFVSQLGSEHAVLGMGVVFTIMRSLQICVFVVLLVVVYQDDLSPLPLFGTVFLLTMVVGCIFSYFIVPWWISYFSIDAGASIGPFAMGLGFLLVAVLALFLIFFGSGANLDALTFERKTAALPTDREAVCDALAKECGMTQREQDVLYYASLGYSVKKVGETLFISEHTVHTHAKSVYRKLGVHAKQELIDLVDEKCG